jgi:cell division protein FtsW
VLACSCALRARLMPQFLRGLVPALVATGLVAGAVAHEDLGTGVLIAAAAAVILLAAGARLRHFLMFVPPALAGFVLLCLASPYRLRRIETFFDPYLDPQGAGYHMIQSMTAVAGGAGFGRGLGHGLQKFGYLPEDTTDFLYAIICEELGIAGAAVVVGLYIALIWAGLAIVRAQREPILKLVGLGIIATLGLQALINLAVVTGLGPTKGIALPLVSAGGTGWILTAVSLGLLVAMDRGAASEMSEESEPGAQAGALSVRAAPAARAYSPAVPT